MLGLKVIYPAISQCLHLTLCSKPSRWFLFSYILLRETLPGRTFVMMKLIISYRGFLVLLLNVSFVNSLWSWHMSCEIIAFKERGLVLHTRQLFAERSQISEGIQTTVLALVISTWFYDLASLGPLARACSYCTQLLCSSVFCLTLIRIVGDSYTLASPSPEIAMSSCRGLRWV